MGCCCGKPKKSYEVYADCVEISPDIDVNYSNYDPPSLVVENRDICNPTCGRKSSFVDTYDIYNLIYKPPVIF